MELKTIRYINPTYLMRCSSQLNAVAGNADTTACKFLAFTTQKIKAITANVNTIGTNTDAAYTVYQGTSSVGTIAMGTNPVGTPLYVDLQDDITLNDGEFLNFHRVATHGGTMAASIQVEWEFDLDSVLTKDSEKHNTIFDIETTSTSSLPLTISTSSSSDYVYIFWGDGTFTPVAGTDVDCTKTYSTAGDYTVSIKSDKPDVLTKFSLGSSANYDIAFDVADLPSSLEYLSVMSANTISGATHSLPSSLTYIYILGSNTLTGDVSNLPNGLTYIRILGSNTLTGDVSNLPDGLTYIVISGSNTLTGDVSDLPDGLTYVIIIGSNTLTGDVSDLPDGLTYIYITGSNTLTGDVSNLPDGLTYIYILGSNTLTGDVSNLPDGLTYIRILGSNTLTGDVSDLPGGLTDVYIGGSNTLTGDVSDLPDGLTYVIITGSNNISDYTTFSFISSTFDRFQLTPESVGLSSAEVDQLLIDFDSNITSWTGGKVISLTGANSARTSSSDAAVTSLEGKGVTVTTS